MTAAEIRVQAQLHISMEISEQMSCKFLTEALQEIALDYKSGRKRESTTLERVREQWIDLPTDFISVRSIKDENGYKIDEYEIDDGQIMFFENGACTLEYYRLPASIVRDTDTPEVHRFYHMPMSYFVASKERARQMGSKDNEAIDLLQQFYYKAKKADTQIKREERRRRKMKAPNWEV